MKILENLKSENISYYASNPETDEWSFVYSGAHHDNIRDILRGHKGEKETDANGTVASLDPEEVEKILKGLKGLEKNKINEDKWSWNFLGKGKEKILIYYNSDDYAYTEWVYPKESYDTEGTTYNIFCPTENKINMKKM